MSSQHLPPPGIIAHRGGAHYAPENTFSAFSQALNWNIAGMECDLQLSSDGIPLLYHDRFLGKLGLPGKHIGEYSLKELKQKDTGSWFNEHFSGERILSFEDFLGSFGSAKKNKGVSLFIELKCRPWEKEQKFEAYFAQTVINIIERYKPQQKLLLMSYDETLIKHILSFKCHYPTLLLRHPGEEFPPNLIDQGLKGIGLHINELDHNHLEIARKYKLATLSHTCNTEQDFILAEKHHIRWWVSDNPPFCTQWLSDRAHG